MPAWIRTRPLVLTLIGIGFANLAQPALSFAESPENATAAKRSSPSAPWSAALVAEGEPPAFEDICFLPFDTAKSLPQAEDLHQWFDVIAGQPQGIFETKTRQGQTAGIEGIVRLKAPWLPDTALKVALEDYNRLQIHFFRGDTGVTLVYHEDDLFRWAAYATKRQPRSVTPSEWTLVATDQHRNRRTFPKNHDHYELRYINTEMVLSRGDVVLLRAPISGPPDDVYFQGKAAFHGISLIRSRGFPAGVESIPVGQVIRPVEMTWVRQLDERATSDLQPDGGIELSVSDRPKKRSWIAAPLPRDKPAELILEIDHAAPGAGLYLGNGKDGPRYVLRYATDRRSKQLCLLVRHDDDLDEHEFRALTEFPLPVVQPHHWIRLVFGAGQLRWWVSSDGKHWAEPVEPIRNLPPDLTHIGLHCVSRHGPVRIALQKLEVRELAGFALLAPTELREQAVSRATLPSIGAWLSDVTELTPAGADSNAWRRACAIKTLAAGTSRQLGNDLLLLLLDDSFTKRLALEQQLRILEEAALLLDVWDDAGALQKLRDRFFEAGRSAWLQEGTPPFSAIRHALMTVPLATRHAIEVATDEILRLEILQWVQARDWTQLARLVGDLRFFQLQSKTPLTDWADSLAIRKMPASAVATTALTKQKDEWRDLLVEELNKDVYNALAELRIEMSGAGRDDAARVIAGLDPQWDQGVSPHWQDEQLLISLPAAIRDVLQGDPGLREVLSTQYGEVARFRLRQAIDQLDFESISRLAWQFAPTEAAVDAQIWLGDRALASGLFSQAYAHYRVAERSTSPSFTASLAPKIRLAEVLSGQTPGVPLSGTAVIGTVRYSADEFEKLVKEISARQASENSRRVLAAGTSSRSVPTPPPAAYQVHRRARLDGLVGNDPNREFARDTTRWQLDWVDRQLGVVVENQWMYVCNRFQVAAYDLQAKQRMWQTQQPPGQIQFAQESPFIASRPLLSADRIWVRLFYGSGATLACVDRTNGQFVWTTTPSPNEALISDPFLLGHELSCFKLVRTEQQEGIVRLVSFDTRTGYARHEQDVVRLRDWWHRRRSCEFAVLNDGIAVQFGGVVVRLDADGRVLWMRRQMTLPPDEDPQWARQWFQPPFVVGDRLLVFQPGGISLECLHADTGNVVWSKVAVDFERLAGIVNDQVIAQTNRGLTALDLADGRIRWTLELEGLTAGVTSSDRGDLLAVQRLPTDANRSRFRPRLIWIDPVKGEIRGSSALPDLEEADPRVGPLVVDQDRLWTFWGKGQSDPTRDVVELIPSGAAETFVASHATDAWARHIDPRLAAAAATLSPSWHLLHGEFGDVSGLIPEIHGEKNVLGVRYRNSGPVVLGREIAFPSRGNAQLRMRFGNEPGHKWKLEVRFHGEIIWSQQITAESHPQPWKDFSVNLSQLAGREGWLTVRASLIQGGDAPVYWKSLELVF